MLNFKALRACLILYKGQIGLVLVYAQDFYRIRDFRAFMAKKTPDELTDKQAEARATDALRPALTTPYKPQAEMKIGKRLAPKKKKRH